MPFTGEFVSSVAEIIKTGTELELYNMFIPENQEQADDMDRMMDHFHACLALHLAKFDTNTRTGTGSGTPVTP
jgi:hypothetical protein